MRVPVATKSHHYEVVLGHRFLTKAIQTFADQLKKQINCLSLQMLMYGRHRETISRQISHMILKCLFCLVAKHAKPLSNIMQLKLFTRAKMLAEIIYFCFWWRGCWRFNGVCCSNLYAWSSIYSNSNNYFGA